MRADGGRADIPKLFTLLGADRSGTIELNEVVHCVERLSDEYNQGFDQDVIRKSCQRQREQGADRQEPDGRERHTVVALA